MFRRMLMRRIEAFVVVQNESKKINIAMERLYEGNRVVERSEGRKEQMEKM